MEHIDNSQNKFDWKRHTITQKSLLGKDLPPLDYLVEELITTPGLVVLGGKKKLGKSWMMLQLAQCVASGSPFLGKATKQGKVRYLALEDGERRLKQRLERQNADNTLPIVYSHRWSSLNSEKGFEALVEMIQEKKPALVVIDTLTAARDKSAKESEADAMGELFNALHLLANSGNTVILVVSHHGKKLHNDVGFDIRGSSAIPGATDTNLGLYKNTDGTFSLKAEGRDILEAELRIQFDSEITWNWKWLDYDRDIRRVEAEARILEVIKRLGGAFASDIAKELGLSKPTVYTHLKRMIAEKRVEYEKVETPNGVKKFYRIIQKTGATSPTQLTSKPSRDSRSSEGSRRIGDVGAGSRGMKNYVSSDEDALTDEDCREMMRILRQVPDGTDVSQLISAYMFGSDDEENQLYMESWPRQGVTGNSTSMVTKYIEQHRKNMKIFQNKE